jgi:pSer/pThr/pTyr-binding forkhead associated (FHA) protein
LTVEKKGVKLASLLFITSFPEAAMNSYQLNMKIGPTPGKLIPLGKAEVLIGRELSNDIVISDADVSRKHARMVQQADSYLLEDLGSTNGTFVNGLRLTAPQLLKPGDRVRLGETVELAFEKSGSDADVTRLKSEAGEFEATMLADEKVAEAYSPAAFKSPPPQAVPPQANAYASAAPAGVTPAYDLDLPEQDKSKRNLRIGLIAGAGCILFLCLCAVSVYLIYTYVWPNL